MSSGLPAQPATPVLLADGEVGLDRRYRTPLFRFFFRRTRSPDEAEDLTQEVFLKLLGAANFRHAARPDSYVFTVAANVYRDRTRTVAGRAREAIVSLDDENFRFDPNLAEDRGPDRVLLGREAVATVAAALSELPEKTREIFMQFRFDSMSQRDIAKRQAISVSAVEKHVARALAHITQRVSGS